MNIPQSFRKQVSQLESLITAGKSAWVKAGQLLVEMIDSNEDNNVFEMIITINPTIRSDTLELLERIGRNPAVVDLIMSDDYVSRKLLQLDDRDIERAQTKPLPVVIETEAGPKVVNKRLDEMTRDEYDQVIQDGKIHTPAEQTKILERRKEQRAAGSRRYVITGNKVTFYERCTFTAPELEKIIAQLRP